MKTLLLSLSLFTSLSAFANTGSIQGLPDGSYLGQFKGQRKGKVNMIVKSYAGCQGCFIAIFVVDPNQSIFDGNKTPELVAYSAVPHSKMSANAGKKSADQTGQYDLTPFGIAADGKLTIPIADPALTLNIIKNNGSDDVHFTIVSANDVNPIGIQAGMSFDKERESAFELSAPVSGHYKAYHSNNKRSMDIGTVLQNESDSARSSPVSWTGDRILSKSGNFLLKEQIPYVYSFTRVSTLATGDEENKVPSFITMFVEKRGKRMALLVNPIQSTDVRRYDLDGSEVPEYLKVQPYVAEPEAPVGAPIANSGGIEMGGKNLEYPGGPTSTVTEAEIKTLEKWALKATLEISRIRNKVEGVLSDQEKKDIMVKRLESLASKLELNAKDLLVRQSLYAGLTLVRIIDAARVARGPTAGEVSEQVDILQKAMNLAETYYKADQVYLNGMLKNRDATKLSDKLADFGLELTSYISDMATRMRPINLLASYGALRWSLGVLNRKILDDDNGRSMYHDVVLNLVNELQQNFPEMEAVAKNESDIEIAVKIQGLRKLYLQTQKEVNIVKSSLK